MTGTTSRRALDEAWQMIGLDTSVVVRLLCGLPEDQALVARERLDLAVHRAERILVTDLCIAESYHALQCHYEVPKEEARRMLHSFVTSGIVDLAPPCCVPALAPSQGAGLVDRMIHARHRQEGASTLTFDRRQGSLEGATRLP